MLLNAILIVFIITIVGCVIFYYYGTLKKQDWNEEYTNPFTLDYLTRAVADVFATTLRQNLKELNMSRKQLEQSEHLKNDLRNSLKEAAYGNKNSKKFVINYIKDILMTHQSIKISEMDIDKVIHFNSPSALKSREKFEIILHIYNKKYKEKGFTTLINKYGLKDPIYAEDGTFHYEVTSEKIAEIYDHVIFDAPKLTYMDKIEIIAQRIFADYKGFGAADMLFDTTVDEIDCGVSGVPKDSYDIKQSDLKKAEFSYESIWVMVSGINIKLSCLSFGTQDELVRVCQNIYKFNAPQSLSKKNGYVVSTMKDGSRIVVCRPPFCESWCFFARKFDSTPSIEPAKLLNDENNFIPIILMKWFIKGYRTIAITGSQGTGKSTTLKSFIKFIPEDLNLRIQELAFELNLRYVYPKRNIVTFQETETISAQAGLDLQKKTNGSVNIIGEVASAAAASWVIQTAMVASLYTIFTHHAKTAYDLIIAIRNNLLETGGYSNEKAAEEMVAKVLNIDFHMERMKGHRFCSRITEIVPIRDRRYPSEKPNTDNKPMDELLAEDTMEFHKRQTDRQVFEPVNLMEWVQIPTDETTADGKEEIKGKYVMRHMPSEDMMFEIRKNLSEAEEQLFLKDMAQLEKLIEVA